MAFGSDRCRCALALLSSWRNIGAVRANAAVSPAMPAGHVGVAAINSVGASLLAYVDVFSSGCDWHRSGLRQPSRRPARAARPACPRASGTGRAEECVFTGRIRKIGKESFRRSEQGVRVDLRTAVLVKQEPHRGC
jgi:hypothetical protein